MRRSLSDLIIEPLRKGEAGAPGFVSNLPFRAQALGELSSLSNATAEVRFQNAHEPAEVDEPSCRIDH
jgi:hypothetical protein